MQALEAARAITDHTRRRQLLATLAPQVAAELVDDLWRDAWVAALSDERHRAVSLAEVILEVPESLLIELVPQIRILRDRRLVIDALVSRWNEISDRVRTALSSPRSIPELATLTLSSATQILTQAETSRSDWDRALAVEQAVPYLRSRADIETALQLVRNISHSAAIAHAFDRLLEASDPNVIAQAEQEALRLAPRGSLGRAQLAAALKRTRRTNPSESWLTAASYAIENEFAIHQVYGVDVNTQWVLELADALPAERRHSVWTRVLRVLARGKRSEVLGDFSAIARSVLGIGGPARGPELIDALKASTEWWP